VITDYVGRRTAGDRSESRIVNQRRELMLAASVTMPMINQPDSGENR
jgi:hypothetical protein